MSAPTAKSQRLEAGETPALRGFNDGYGDASVGDPRNPDRWLSQLGFTAADQQIYRQEYNRGYDSVSPISPSPTPTSSVLPARRAELQRRGYQDGTRDIQSNFGSNPNSYIASLGLTDPAEIQIYTSAYNAGYQRQPTPSPLPSASISPGRLTELRQQGYKEGYADAQSNFPRDAGRGINLWGLVNAAEQSAYRNGYSSGYQAYLNSQLPVAPLW